jgi:hypothetical protein
LESLEQKKSLKVRGLPQNKALLSEHRGQYKTR